MRLIDADAVDQVLLVLRDRECGTPLAVIDWVAGVVSKSPTIDAVPVIRCAACKYTFVVTDQDGGRHLCCYMHGRRDLKEDDFCSYAELRK